MVDCHCQAAEADCHPEVAAGYHHLVAPVRFRLAAGVGYFPHRVVVGDSRYLAVADGPLREVAVDCRYQAAADDFRCPAVADQDPVAAGHHPVGEPVGEDALAAVRAAGSESAVHTSDCDRDRRGG
jgi:hypothetical protein